MPDGVLILDARWCQLDGNITLQGVESLPKKVQCSKHVYKSDTSDRPSNDMGYNHVGFYSMQYAFLLWFCGCNYALLRRGVSAV